MIEAIIAFPIVVTFTLCLAQYAFLSSAQNGVRFAAFQAARVASAIRGGTYAGESPGIRPGSFKEALIQRAAALSLAGSGPAPEAISGLRQRDLSRLLGQWGGLRGPSEATFVVPTVATPGSGLDKLFGGSDQPLSQRMPPRAAHALEHTTVRLINDASLGFQKGFRARVEYTAPCTVPVAAQILCSGGFRTLAAEAPGNFHDRPVAPCETTPAGCL